MCGGGLYRRGDEIEWNAASVVFAVDFRQGTEQEIRDIGQDGGTARRDAVLDHENGQASQEGVDGGGALESGEELVAEVGGEVGFGLHDVHGGVARAPSGVAEDGEVAAASGEGAMATVAKGSGIECLRIHGDARFLRVKLGVCPRQFAKRLQSVERKRVAGTFVMEKLGNRARSREDAFRGVRSRQGLGSS